MYPSKRAAIEAGAQKLYDRISSFEEALGLIETLDLIASKGAHAARPADGVQLWYGCKIFIDRVFEEEARDVILTFWDGSVSEFFQDFWARPRKDIAERIAAAKWANSMEGISDLRRFWGVNPSQVTTDELLAFSLTLPLDSASKLSQSGWLVPVGDVVAAQQADLAKLRLRQAGGRAGKLPDSDSTVSMLRNRRAEDALYAELIRKEREWQKQQKKLEQQRD